MDSQITYPLPIMPASPGLRLFLLGAAHILLDGVPVTPQLSRRAQALFYYLAVEKKPQSRDHLASLFWPDVPNQQAKKNLRNLLPELRTYLNDYLVIGLSTIEFRPTHPYWIDLEFMREKMQVYAHPGMLDPGTVDPGDNKQNLVTFLVEAVEQQQGEFLAGFSIPNAPFYEEWLVAQRQHVRQSITEQLYGLASEAFQQNRRERALQATRALLQLQPWHEPAYRLQMEILAQQGERNSALQQYQQLKRILRTTWNVEPEPATEWLVEQIRKGVIAPPAAHPAPSPPVERPSVPDNRFPHNCFPHNLPVQLTPFIGRRQELSEILAALADAQQRLITLVGLGGVGKTRLALAAADRLIEQAGKTNAQAWQCSDGIWFVPLANLLTNQQTAEAQTEAVATALADALRLPRIAQTPMAGQVIDALQNRHLLLILDSFEHLLTSVDFLLDLLQQTLHVKVLVTSRQLLNVQAERVFEVTGLALPRLEMEETETGVKLLHYDSIQLFVNRAQRVNHSFAVTAQNQREIVRICHLLDGLPLAIELAATLVFHYGCAQIYQQLHQDLLLLASPQRDLPPRHRSLKAMLDSSWHFLSNQQRQVLAACSVFAGSFSEEAALTVTGAQPATLNQLVDQSLLKHIIGDDTGDRFDLHDVVRHYAAQQLQQDAQEEQLRRERHAHYYAHLIESDINELCRSPAKFQLIQQELANFQTAWQWSLAHYHIPFLQKLCEPIYFHYLFQGPFQECLEWLKTGLQTLRRTPLCAMSQAEISIYRVGLAAQSYLAYYAGRYQETEQLAPEAIALAQPVMDFRTQVLAHYALGMLAFARGESEQQLSHFQRALADSRSSQVAYLTISSLAYYGFGLATQGQIGEALDSLHEAMQLLREHGVVMLEGYLLSELSFVYAMTGDWALAENTTEQALSISQRLHSNLRRGWQYEYMARYAEAVGDYPRAITWTEQALDIGLMNQDLDNRLGALLIRSRALLQLNDLPAAEQALQKMFALTQPVNRPVETAKAHIEMGHLLSARQARAEATQHYQAAIDFATTAGVPVLAAAQAGLAALAGQQRETAAALMWAERCSQHLLTQSLDLQYDVVSATLRCYEVFQQANDQRAGTILQQTNRWLEERASKISDETLRQAFLEKVPAHRRLRELIAS